jgi:predicted nucleic acid-binding protein
MVKKEAVSNTSTIIFASKINRLDLLKNIFKKIFVPFEVINELFKKESPENNVIKKEVGVLFNEVKVRKFLNIPIGIGERAAISYCIEKKVPIFMSDDKKARNFAESFNIQPIGILGIILVNLKNKFINVDEAKKIFQELIEKDFYVSSDIYAEMMKQIELVGNNRGAEC